MYCPKCGEENPSNTQECGSCHHTLTNNPTMQLTTYPKRSKMAVTSFLLAILGLLFSALVLILTTIVGITALAILSLLLSLLTAIPAIILGIIGLVIIVRSRGQVKGIGLAIAGIVISAICVLLSTRLALLMPALIEVRSSAQETKQKAQLQTIEMALAAFRNGYGDYPPSNALDKDNKHYCGALKLCEAMFGQDLMGFHPDSRFKSDGTDDSGNSLYVPATANAGRRPYIDPKSANVYRLQDVFEDVGPFDGNSFVICDVYTKKRHSDKKTGMPILYYRANTSNKTMDASEPMDKRIYNAEDNLDLIRLGSPGNGRTHNLAGDEGEFFYDKGYKVIDPRITIISRPYRPDSFILISAGKDGLYGTEDDVTNFGE